MSFLSFPRAEVLFGPDHLRISRARAFYRRHFGWPLVALLALTALLMPIGDRVWADLLYAAEGHAWTLRSGFVTEDLVHQFGKWLSTTAWLGVAVAWCIACWRADLAHWRRPLGYLAVTTLMSALLVAWMKSWSDMDCPWDLFRYGGERAYHGLFAHRALGMPVGRCFPAGHASAGYAWVALYFFFRATRPRWRGMGLTIGLVAGGVFGLSQQLRGAHFLSHDLWTLAICWFTAFATYVAYFRPRFKPVHARGQQDTP